MGDIPKWLRNILKGIGFANLFFSITGLLFWLILVVTFSFFPLNFLTQNLPFFNQFVITMEIFNLIFLVGLFATGWILVKGSVQIIMPCNILFILELIYFYSIKIFSKIQGHQITESLTMANGVGNMGLLFQMLPVYPIIALVLLNFANFKIKGLPTDHEATGELKEEGRLSNASLGVVIFAYWFMFSSLISLGAVFFTDRMYEFNTGLFGEVLLLQNFSTFVIGFFILKRKEWARRGIILLTAAGLLLTMAYSNVPYLRDLVQKEQIQEMHHQALVERAMMERMEIQDSNGVSDYYSERSKEIMKTVDQRVRSIERSEFLKQVPVLFSFLWFLFVFYFFTRPRVKEDFTWDPDIGKSGRFFIRFLSILGVLVLCVIVYLFQIESRQNEIWRQGQVLMAHGKNKGAVEVLSKGILILPGNGHLYASRGIAYRNMGEWQKAFEDYSRAIWFDPGDQELYLRRGYVLEMMGDKNRAFRDYNKALELNPYYIQALINRSLIYFGRNMYSLALSDCYLVVKHAPNNFDGQLTMGCIYDRLQRPLTALRYFNKAVELRPQEAHGYINRGKEYLDIGEKDKALEDFNKAIALDPDDPDAYSKRADYWFYIKDYPRAAEDQAMVYRLYPDSTDALYWYMYFYYRVGDMVKVKAVYPMVPKSKFKSLQRTAGFYELITQTHSDGVIKGLDKDNGIFYERMFKNGRLNGPARDFDEKGHLINAFGFLNGVINGTWKIYRDNKLEQEWTYQEDKAQGTSKQYFADGKLKCTWMYENGKADGPFSCYDPDGRLEWEGAFKDGFRNGIQRTYHSNGKLWALENYKLGDKDGLQQYFDDKGIKTAEGLYKDGVSVMTKLLK